MSAEHGRFRNLRRIARRVFSTEGAAVSGIGVSLAGAVYGVNDVVAIYSEVHHEMASREQSGLIPPKPDQELLKSGREIVPTLEAQHVLPVYRQEVVKGNRSVTIVFPDLMMQNQREISAVQDASTRSREEKSINDDINSQPSTFGWRRIDRDGALLLGGVIGALASGVFGLLLPTNIRAQRVRQSAPSQT